MDQALVEKHLVHTAESVDLLRRLGKPDQLQRDPVQFGFVVHTLQTAVQAAIDTAAIIVSERRLGEPATNRDLFAKLAPAPGRCGDELPAPRRRRGLGRVHDRCAAPALTGPGSLPARACPKSAK